MMAKKVTDKIAYITTMKRGLPTFVYRELAQLAAAGLVPAVFTTKFAPGLYMPDADWPLVRLRPFFTLIRQPVLFLRRPGRYLRLLALARQTNSLVDFLVGCDYAARMEKMGVTTVHCVEGLHSLAIGYYCHLLTGLPLSVTVHADALYMSDDWPIVHRALAACQFVTTVCEFNRAKLIDEFGLPPEHVHVVRLFVDYNAFKPNDKVKVLIVGQFSQRKGHETLLKAIKKLNRDDIHLWVVGEGTWGSVGDFVNVRQLAEDLNVTDRVTFFGSVSEAVLRVLYQTCDIFCLPSRKYVVNEGLPVSLMEAMACAKPVISTHHAGIPELVPDILIAENDDAALAEALAYLADNPQVRQEMGVRNRQIVMQNYSTTNVAQMVDLFKGTSSLPGGTDLEEVDDARNGHRRSRIHRVVSG